MSLEPWPLFWLLLTVGAYACSRYLYRRTGRYLLSPLMLVPALLLVLAVPLRTSYAEYTSNAHFLTLMLGPCMVAFAIPVWQQRAMLARHWLPLLLGMVVGSVVSIVSSWLLAGLFSLDADISYSLLPHSVFSPIAMPLAGNIGGVPELASVFVMATGVFGAAAGSVLLRWIPMRTALARGTLFGVSAHGAGVSRAREFGNQEGAVAGLAMVLTGLLNLLLAPLLALLLQAPAARQIIG
ncbi:LrgB family protein [Janthinobacterium sp. 17J80-10]|uniref:LrgB family protein n=1 Tax=Janthinobacterium sp. 17J80-10 TaxID=2497863 RepID=UPI001005A36F|nr:LrgB family protein [Janthinobacterium sp. 17J80-10]QAU32903.1 LrgB family protein [Janthinobacterium sp. 17J80-10]